MRSNAPALHSKLSDVSPRSDGCSLSALRPIEIEGVPVRRLFGTPIHALDLCETVALAGRCIDERRRMLIGVVNAAKLVNMRKSTLLRESVLTADIVLADGMSVVWACGLLGRPLKERVPGINLMFELLALADKRGYRVYCLGAKPEVVEAVAARIREQYPRAELAGYHDGYFTADEEPALVDEIRAARPDIIFVAMSPPKKEQFLARWTDTLEIPVCHGVGGSFDVMAGKTKRAPRFLQRIGMEWFYRLIQEPRRMAGRYLVTNTVFLWLLLGELAMPSKVAAE